MTGYRDHWIECTDTAVRVRGYYFPWGTKQIPYQKIRSVRRVAMAAMRGKGRIWGTANPRYWAGFDPGRPGKQTALILDLGGLVHPFLTPDDPDAVEEIIRRHTALGPQGNRPGPIV